MIDNYVTRRTFLEKTWKAALTGSTFLYIQNTLGCAPFPKEDRKHVSQIKWRCNPALPIPENGGIYIGTNKSSCLYLSEEDVVHGFKNSYGKNPTFLAPGKGRIGASDNRFP